MLQPPVSKHDHKRGNPNAPITLVEFGDYECPDCGAAYPILQQIQETMGKGLCFVFRNFPLTQIHPYALTAAKAAEAAGHDEKFWEMHDTLFENQDALTDDDVIRYAENLGIDMDKFIKQFRSQAVEEKIHHDFVSGLRSGVNGTPTFFINGYLYNGDYSYNTLLYTLQQVTEQGGTYV